ncbi:PAS domain-containing protein [Lichenicoccus roseus]|uniref:histidine kinase n=1 Tax=Lichenicoccus roseus TaxID=2683649 RepID=A0A5R9JAB5_9PROT|nr:PAS domain-containing protein [Lichenicoccus roseus]TLU71148.1 PAS domain-containing protein [Lichenicoccus roseus]
MPSIITISWDKMPDTHDLNPEDGSPRHYISGGRNVVAPDGSPTGATDIFFAAVQMSRMPMVLTDPHQPDDPIIFCNHAFELLTGCTQEEILGRNCRFLQGDATDPNTVVEIRRSLCAGRDVHLEMLNYRKDGSTFWNALFISPVVDTSGKLVYHFASQIDVSRRREAEAVMQQAQRMETLGAMASSLANEFNNLMTIVLANLERLAAEQRPDRRAQQIERAAWGASRAAKLTDQMLSFAHRQYHDDQMIDVNETLTNCDGILDQMARPLAEVRLDLAPVRLTTSLDASQLEMAVLNLIRNAADAGPPGSKITICTRQRHFDEQGDIPAIEIAFIDQGSGMDPDVALRATEPFFTTKQPGRGTGLGLSMVKGFVEQSNGRLEIETKEGLGTTIRLIFREAAA